VHEMHAHWQREHFPVILNRRIKTGFAQPPVLNGTIHRNLDPTEIINDLMKAVEIDTSVVVNFQTEVVANGVDEKLRPFAFAKIGFAPTKSGVDAGNLMIRYIDVEIAWDREHRHRTRRPIYRDDGQHVRAPRIIGVGGI